ncbi:cytochrome P450 [Streptantibioticus rubrisoli]|uniref:Cytochrome P450 n=1 Tax=Streptantibioticus rubrisoli TaxID=1387313 RepID=A0ABT1PDG2_9ACTN|nr:cytochrome P450 [Streptantibioticus rubrisoli]MCQ4043400.1 cytochrome P450 [Streptantibioticus rubrisoli]
MTELPTFPMARTCPFAPPQEYAELRAQGPLAKATLWNGKETWLVTGYDLVRKLLQDPRISSEPPRLATLAASEEGQTETFRTFVGMDPPEHGVYRRMLTSYFTVKRVQAMRPAIQRTAEELVDQILATEGPVDLVEALAMPLATMVICELLGVPYADREFFHSRSSVAIQSATAEETAAAFMDLYQYLDKLVTAKEAEPDEGLISRLVEGPWRAGALTHQELVNTSVLLLIVGHETSANMIGLGALTLMRHPDVVAELRAKPELLPAAVDELLRYHSSADWLRRAAKEDIEIDGTVIKAGDSVIGLAAAANRDERFTNPDEFDIHRTERHHLAFGYGPHQCIGQHLAKAELEIAFGTLFDKIPDIVPAVELDELPFKHDATLFGLYRLPVTFARP